VPVAALTVVLSCGITASILVLLLVAVRKLFEGTFSFPRLTERTRPYRSGPGVARGGGPRSAGVREPRRPRPGFGAGSIALPEPADEREAG